METNTPLRDEFDLRIPIDLRKPDDEGYDPVISHISRTVLIVSLLTAWFGNLVFYGQSIGLNLSFYVLSLLVGVVLLLFNYQRHIEPKHAIFALPAMLFSLFTAWTANDFLQFLNVIIVLGSLFVLFRFISNQRFLGGHWLVSVVTGFNVALLGWIESPILIASQSRRRIKYIELEDNQVHSLLSVIRGCLFAIPVVGVFAILLSSADVVLRAELDDFLSALIPLSFADILGQGFLIFFLAWLAIIGYKTMLFVNTNNHLDNWQPTIPETNPWKWINMIEGGIVLGSVVLLFAVAVFIQARYLFGGGANISDYGYTYSEYARRGFFEIVTVSFMTMSLVVGLRIITKRDTPQQEIYFQGLSMAIIALTLALLVAAFERLSIYVDAYGFTRLRLETRVFIVWLSILFGVLVYDLFQPRLKWFWVGCLVISLGYVMTLNVMNEDRYIASYNIARFERTGKIDVDYLLSLSDDAMPVVAPLLDNDDLAQSKQETLKVGLGYRLYELDDYRENNSWVAYHYSKERAWGILDDYRDDLAGYVEAPVRYNTFDYGDQDQGTYTP